MPKNKPNKGLLKRIRFTKTGKVKFHHAFTSHIMVRRSTKRKRKLRKAAVCTGKINENMAMLLGGR